MNAAEDLKSDMAQLRLVWGEAADRIVDPTALAPLFGADFRLNLRKVLAPLWHAAKLCLKIKALMVGADASLAALTSDPAEAMGIAGDAFAVITGFADSVRQKLHPVAYMTALVLSGTPEGIERASLQKVVTEFIEDAGAASAAGALPWYLGLRSKLIAEARDALKQHSGFEAVLTDLIQKGIIQMKGTVVTYRDRVWEWRSVACN
jgi:hypothetical protein